MGSDHRLGLSNGRKAALYSVRAILYSAPDRTEHI
jgi:hypothetical protein